MKKLFLILATIVVWFTSAYGMRKGGLFGDGAEYTPTQILNLPTPWIAKRTNGHLPHNSGRSLQQLYGLRRVVNEKYTSSESLATFNRNCVVVNFRNRTLETRDFSSMCKGN